MVTATDSIKFDANAGLPLLPEAADAMMAELGRMANPSAVHQAGRAARHTVERARDSVANLVGAKPDHVIFTSGATEAACTALSPHYLAGRTEIPIGHLYVGASEHPCVLSGGRFRPDQVTRLPVTEDGVIDLDALDAHLTQHDPDKGRALVALMLANNESGVIHPIARASEIAKHHDALLFCDVVQAVGRLPVDFEALGADVIAISAHKIGGPQGIGALILASDTLTPKPLLTGGAQERYRRAGTENVPAIAGFAVACDAVNTHLSRRSNVAELRDKLQQGLEQQNPSTKVFGSEAERLPNTLLFAVPGIIGETAVIALDLAGVAVSSGSACSSGKVGPSHVLSAMGADSEIAKCGIRVSLPHSAKEKEVNEFLSIWAEIANRIIQRDAA